MWGGQIAILFTHNGADNSFYELVQNIKSGKLPYRLHRADFDQAVAQGLYKTVRRSLKKSWKTEDEEKYKADIIKQYCDAADEELFCVPRKSDGTYIPLNLIETAMINGDEKVIVRIGPPAADFFDWPRPVIEAWTALFIAQDLESRFAFLDNKLRRVYGYDVAPLRRSFRSLGFGRKRKS